MDLRAKVPLFLNAVMGQPATISGASPLSLPKAKANSLSGVKAFGDCSQSSTPTPSNPVDIVCNNGVLKWDSVNEEVYADGTTEKIAVKKLGPVGYDIVGSPTINYEVASGFSLANYLKTSSVITDTINELELCIAVSPSNLSGSGNNQALLAPVSNTDGQGIFLQSRNSTGQIRWCLSSAEAEGWDIVVRWTNYYLTVGDKFLIKLTYDGAIYKLFASKNGGAFELVDSVESTKKIINGYAYAFGRNIYANQYFVGSIDIKNTYIKINNSLWFGQENIPGNTEATCENLLAIQTYRDVQSVLDGVVTRKIGIMVLDGTENWQTHNTWFWASVFDPLGTDTSARLICTHFKNQGPTNDLSIHRDTADSTYLQISYSAMSTVADFKTWLAGQYAAGTPVIVVYMKSTPTTEQVTGQTMQVVSGNNIAEITQASMTGLELEATYRRNK